MGQKPEHRVIALACDAQAFGYDGMRLLELRIHR